jgi:hypothetical protein
MKKTMLLIALFAAALFGQTRKINETTVQVYGPNGSVTQRTYEEKNSRGWTDSAGQVMTGVAYGTERVLYGVDTWRRTTNERERDRQIAANEQRRIEAQRETELARIEADVIRDRQQADTERERVRTERERNSTQAAVDVFRTSAETDSNGTVTVNGVTIRVNTTKPTAARKP